MHKVNYTMHAGATPDAAQVLVFPVLAILFSFFVLLGEFQVSDSMIPQDSTMHVLDSNVHFYEVSAY